MLGVCLHYNYKIYIYTFFIHVPEAFCTILYHFQKSRNRVLPKTNESKSINVRNIDFMIPYGLTLEKHVFGFQSHVVEKNFLSLEKPVYQTDLLGVRGLSFHCIGRFILLTLFKLLDQIKF